MIPQQDQVLPLDLNVDIPTCCHHWMIEPANGPLSRGKCRHCNEVRMFENTVTVREWGDDPAE
ncbi:MAG: hypothetical protein ACE5Q6_05155 [Dehalococcoidia bacterium]